MAWSAFAIDLYCTSAHFICGIAYCVYYFVVDDKYHFF